MHLSGKTAVVAALAVAALVAPAPASADHHEIMVREVFPGSADAGANAEFVELQMHAAGQGNLNPEARLEFFASNGLTIGTLASSDAANDGNQRTVLAGTNAAEVEFGVDTDINYSNISGGDLMSPAGGAVCLKSTNVDFGTIDCAAWGTITNPPASAGSPEPAITDGSSIQRTISRGCPTLLDGPDDTNQSSADFGPLGSPTPRNNATTPTETACPSPATIPPGFDLFETSPEETSLPLGGPTAIPAGFFDPGSDPFSGIVPLSGVPLETFGTATTGDADTVIRRSQPLDFSGVFPRQDTVPIELVALSLVSVEPITVTYNGGQDAQRWDLGLSLGPQQQLPGSAGVTQNAQAGGTLNFQLPALPLLTFTRLSDGATRALDLRQVVQPPGYPNFTLQASNVPWRNQGCALPALRISTLTDTFCPGLTPGPPPVKQLTLAQAPADVHGLFPVQPMLEHFKCYSLEQKPFQARTAQLADQFGSRNADVRSRRELCNPAQKNQEPFVNKAAHLQCYDAPGPAVNEQVQIRNQLGSQRMTVGEPERLCVPSEKRKPGQQFQPFSPLQIDHFQCYKVTPDSAILTANPINRVNLKDQFGKEKRVKILEPVRLCAPAEKDNEQDVQHQVKHLACYKIKDGRKARDFEIRNQYEQRKLQTRKPVGLCVPSAKLVLP